MDGFYLIHLNYKNVIEYCLKDVDNIHDMSLELCLGLLLRINHNILVFILFSYYDIFLIPTWELFHNAAYPLKLR